MAEKETNDAHCAIVQNWASDEELRRVLRACGSPDEFLVLIAEVKVIRDERGRRTWLFRTIKDISGWIVAVGAGGTLIFKLISWYHGGGG